MKTKISTQADIERAMIIALIFLLINIISTDIILKDMGKYCGIIWFVISILRIIGSFINQPEEETV